MSNIRGLGDVAGKKEDDDDDKQNNLYTGGAASGMSVIGPPSGGSDSNAMDAAVKLATAHGAAGSSAGDAPGGSVNVTFYKNGFTVGDGPLRTKDDPANAKFLQQISQGYVPEELSSEGKEMNMSLVDKRTEDYATPPEPLYNAYSGSGCSVGSSAPVAGAVVASGDSKAGTFSLDESQPTTTIQFRLSDGKKIRAKFNLTHTVADIHAYLAQEGAAGSAYMLLSGFPPKPLTDQATTIEAAGLKMGSITQKLA